MHSRYNGYSFPLRDTVKREKIHFHNRYGIQLCGDLYLPKDAQGKIPAVAVSGPFGAVKEQCSGLYAEELAAREFQELLAQGPLTVEMADYGGFEKVGALGTTLTRNDTQITTQPGDVILYQGNQITIYYGTNSWNFTRLARIDDPSGLQEKLGDGTVSVTFSLA